MDTSELLEVLAYEPSVNCGALMGLLSTENEPKVGSTYFLRVSPSGLKPRLKLIFAEEAMGGIGFSGTLGKSFDLPLRPSNLPNVESTEYGDSDDAELKSPVIDLSMLIISSN